MSTASKIESNNEHLTKLAEQIKVEQAGLLASMRQGLAHARRIGELLIEVKRVVGKRGFEPWLRANCSFGKVTAYTYLNASTQ